MPSFITPYLPDSFTTLLFWMIALDVLSGVLKAARQRRLSSVLSTSGVTRKAGMLLIVGTAHLVHYAISRLLPASVAMPIGEATAVYYCVSELFSLLENGKALGLPIPGFIWKYFKQASDAAGIELPAEPDASLFDQAADFLQHRDEATAPAAAPGSTAANPASAEDPSK